ncbi:thioredoxin family protein [Leptothoe spongobia]|uniref:Thioredoxin family protein n=1 Tax=Leptothoe spongobia TAU-MAC 1115 TaxID=1967444 RepID=A0A947DDZ4_9CYAN|nr:thioredoxin family protein [Leptothoe spongobia]MBT9314181.1 thioredoxin family protein [Leptothoe spongobia TAU-MAC 1115]
MSVNSSESEGLAQRLRNFVVVTVAVVLSVAVVLGLQTRTPSASLSDMAEASVPLNQAITNGKPTLVEFYANWCTSCQAMAGDLQQLKHEYQQDVNFVMLNVDNSKWLPEMLHYRVDGIPHFAFLDQSGNDAGAAMGEIPRAVLADNLTALVAGEKLPYAQAEGQTSDVETALEASGAPDDPRSHGAQVVQ